MMKMSGHLKVYSEKEAYLLVPVHSPKVTTISNLLQNISRYITYMYVERWLLLFFLLFKCKITSTPSSILVIQSTIQNVY